MNDRDRLTPVTLTREEPVTKFVVHYLTTEGALGEPRNDPLSRFLVWNPLKCKLKSYGVCVWEHHAGISPGHLPLFHSCHYLISGVRRNENRNDRKIEGTRELEIPLIVRWNSHHRARSERGQDVVAHVHRNLLTGDRVFHVATGEHTGLLAVLKGTVEVTHASGLLSVRRNAIAAGIGRDLIHKGMLRGDHEEGHTEQGIRAGRKGDEIFVCSLNLEMDLSAGLSADPVSLLLFDSFWPINLLKLSEETL